MIKVDFYRDKRQGNVNYGKYYVRAKNNEPIGIPGLAKHIHQHGSLYTEDVILGVLNKIATCIRELVLDGTPVKIDDLCIFTPAVTATPGDTPADYSLAKLSSDSDTTGNIKAVRMHCRTTGNAVPKEMTKDADLGYTTLAAKVKAGAVQLSTAKGVYIVGEDSNGGGNGNG